MIDDDAAKTAATKGGPASENANLAFRFVHGQAHKAGDGRTVQQRLPGGLGRNCARPELLERRQRGRGRVAEISTSAACAAATVASSTLAQLNPSGGGTLGPSRPIPRRLTMVTMS